MKKQWNQPTVIEISPRMMRIQRRRSKGWRMPPNTAYVGRPSKYGNPFKVGKLVPEELYEVLDDQDLFLFDRCSFAGVRINSATEAVELYRKYFPFTGTPYELTPADLAEIANQNLACWCKLGEPCHADHLLKIANQ